MEPAQPNSAENDWSASHEDGLAVFVAACHDALILGRLTPDLDAEVAGLDGPLQAEFAQAKRVLTGLARARQLSERAAEAARQATGRLSWADFGPGSSDATGQPSLKRLGRFIIERELGRGGLGVVFLAQDPVLQRPVALKVPRAEVLLTPDVRARFDREAHAAARLTHPNLVPLYEVGQAGPVCYIASAFCPGRNLVSWLREADQPLSARQAADLTAQLADAVHYAHTQGVLHRDIKPANVLLEPLAATPSIMSAVNQHDKLPFVPKLVDFGLAKLDGGAAGETRAGVAMGTPGYMAPEQAEGRLHDVGPATDVYGLGAVLYELLTGQAPFAGSSNVECLRRVVSDEPVRPNGKARVVPRDLEAISLKCLQKSPDRRYASAGALAEDLRRFLADEPTVARPAGPGERLMKWMRRRPAVAALVAVIIVASILTVGGSLWYSSRIAVALHETTQREAELRQALFPADMRRAQTALTDGASDEALAILGPYRAGEHFDAGFVPKLLARLADRKPAVYDGHQGEAYSVAFAPDGRTLATAGQDHTVRLWDATTGQTIAILRGHTNEVNWVAFSSDGAWLVSTGDDGCVRRWDAKTGQSQGILYGHEQSVHALAVSPNGNQIVTGDENANVKLWDAMRGVRTGKAPFGLPVDAAAFSRAGQVFVATGGSRQVAILSPDFRVEAIVEEQEYPSSLAVSPVEEILAVGTKVGTIALRNSKTLAEVRRWQGHFSNVECLRYSKDGEVLVSCARDGTIRFWDARSGAHIDTLPVGTQRVWSFDLSPDGQGLAAVGQDGRLRVWNLEFPVSMPWKRFVLRTPGEPKLDFAISRDARRLAVRIGPARVRVLDAQSGRERGAIDVHPHSSGYLFSPDGRFLVGGAQGGPLLIWELEAGTPRKIIWYEVPRPPGFSERNRVAFDPASMAVACYVSGQSKAFDLRTGVQLAEIPGIDPMDQPVSFSADGRLTAFVDAAGQIRVADRCMHQHWATITIPQDGRVIGFSPGGRWFAVQTDRAVFFHKQDGQIDHTLPVSQMGYSRLAFTPDERFAASPLEGGMIGVYDLATGQQACQLAGNNANDEIAFTSDGNTLVAAAPNGESVRVAIWSVDAVTRNSRQEK